MESSTTTSTMVSSDPVSSLRAAALSTRKSKGRKPPLERPVTLSLRPPPSNDLLQLDYGQEDTTDPVSKPAMVPSVPVPDIVIKREKTPVILQDIQMREEGEISDEEGPPPLPVQTNDHVRMPPDAAVFAVPQFKTEEEIPIIPPAISFSKSATPEIPQIRPLMDRISDLVGDVPSNFDQDADVPMLDLSEQSVTGDHDLGPDRVRPGLELTQAEYDTAKDVILDLLGWGVPFEHLVDSGISKQLIFYVFNELDLCLPDTFDSSDIAPYAPELLPERRQSVMLSPAIHDARANSIDSDVRTDAPDNSSTPVLPAKDSSPSTDVPTESDLHDMERRRRQELVARKAAVQASRKQNQPAPLESLTETPPPDDSMDLDQDTLEAPPYAATETVEDFLNSLGTVQLDSTPSNAPSIPAHNPLESKTNPHEQSLYGQVIDINDSVQEGPLTSVSESFSISSGQSHSFGPPPSSSSSDPPPSSVASTTASSQISVPPSESTQRRGVKRPVASDFVDFDPPSKRHENSRMDHLNGTGGITRRLNSRMSFQNINSRRLVIDLSDSEDEDDEQQETNQSIDDPPQLWRDKRPYLAKTSSSTTIKSISSGTISPAILEQKELEIRKMRELIAKREEETRLRKLALAKIASANSGQPGASISGIQTRIVKVEAVDSMIKSTSEADEINAHLPEITVHSESLTPPSLDADSWEHSLTPEIPEPSFNIQEPQADSHLSEGERQHFPEESVDVDQTASPSAQMNLEATSSARSEQDSNSQQDSPTLNQDYSQFQDNNQDNFSSYQSPFDLYPLLRSCGQSVSSSPHVLSSCSMYSSRPLLSSDSLSVGTKSPGFYSSTSSSALLPDLKPLRLATLVKSLDPFKRLCQYEVPGGGTCRDEGCEDVHLSRLEDANHLVALEPNDEDTANYLFNTLPLSWLYDHHITSPSRILSALQDIYRNNLNNPLQLEEKVSQCIDSLGSAPTT